MDSGRISSDLSPAERAALEAKKNPQGPGGEETAGVPVAEDPATALGEALEGQDEDEEDTARDLSYEFKMPSPLRRLMGDLVGAVMNVAKTFDPNNTNMELSRALLAEALTAMEFEDVQKWVDKIFPDGYVDPAVAAAQAGPEAPGGGSPFGEFAPPPGAGGQVPGDPAGNPYGAPQRAQSPEQTGLAESHHVTLGRGGEPLVWSRRRISEGALRAADMPPIVKRSMSDRERELDDEFEAVANGLFKTPKK